MAGERRAKHKHGNRGARPFAKPHVEIEQRMKTEFVEQQAMPGRGRSVPGACMIKRISAELRKRCDRGRRHESIDQRRHARMPRGEARAQECGELAPLRGAEPRAKECGELAPAERRGDAQRIVEDRCMTSERVIDHHLLAPQALFVEAGAMTAETGGADTKYAR